MRRRIYQRGCAVVYRADKHSQRPGPRAQDIMPTSYGETYRYQVDKFWVVEEVYDDGTLMARTRRGKMHRLQLSDPHLRHATWWERWWYGRRFPQLSHLEATSKNETPPQVRPGTQNQAG
jgi:hypothetical protein